MDSALLIHRLHFAFTVTYHYLFPQLTMGLAPLIVILKTLALSTGNETYDRAARFWAKIFGINFVIGVVTGIPMEFQFGTNWSHFSRYAGGVIGQTLAMEGLLCVLPGVDVPRSIPLRREAAEPEACIGLRRLWCFWARGFPDTSSSRPMPGCSTPWATIQTADGACNSPASGNWS